MLLHAAGVADVQLPQQALVLHRLSGVQATERYEHPLRAARPGLAAQPGRRGGRCFCGHLHMFPFA